MLLYRFGPQARHPRGTCKMIVPDHKGKILFLFYWCVFPVETEDRIGLERSRDLWHFKEIELLECV